MYIVCQSKAKGGKRCASRIDKDRAKADTKSAKTGTTNINAIICPSCAVSYNRGARPGHRCPKKNLIVLSPATRKILETIKAFGGHPLMVGGSVRDALMSGQSQVSKDIDIEVYGLNIDTLATVLSKVGVVNEVGKVFSVLKMTVEGEDFDISLPRLDSKTGAGHKGFAVQADHTLDEAQAFSRRDYTINAMGWDPFTHELVDPYGGYSDLNARIIRHISQAFKEDPLRVLRGIQFAGRFNFIFAPETLEECRSLRGAFAELSIERVWTEWEKIATKAIVPSKSLQALYDTGWEEHFPELVAIRNVDQGEHWHPEGSVEVHTAMAADLAASISKRDNLSKHDTTVLVLASIAHDFGKATHTQKEADGRITSHGHAEAGEPFAKRFLERLGAPELIKKQVEILVREHMAHATFQEDEMPSRKAVIRLMRRLEGNGNGPTIEQWARLVESDTQGRGTHVKDSPGEKWMAVVRSLNTGMKAPSSILKGEHLMSLGFKPGPAFKEILAQARDAQDSGVFDNEDGAIKWVTQSYKERQ